MMLKFLRHEASAGILLISMSCCALLIANSPLAGSYFNILSYQIAGLTISHWVNDALMTLFFLLVGLEVKRELISGELSQPAQRVLPGIAALGGMLVPAVIYLVINHGRSGQSVGWAIPTVTDIAFALGVLSLLGSRVPVSLKIFLTALAIVDDIGAVIIIALFYTTGVNMPALAGVAGLLLLLVLLNRFNVSRLSPYLIIGIAFWWCMLMSGVHATVAGVLLALTIPHQVLAGRADDTPLLRLEHGLHPWVAFIIIPIFGFANAGVSLAGFSPERLLNPVSLGIFLGLFIGKQLGVFVFPLLAIRFKLADMPAGASLRQLYGVAMLCGIGFTMSLFITLLAFSGTPDIQEASKIGVILGSLFSALLGLWVLVKR